MQPTYLPWLGYFDLIRQADVFVLLDHVQFSRQSWQQRNRIRNRGGEVMLTVPVARDSHATNSISRARIDNSRRTLTKHLTTIEQAYSQSGNAKRLLDELTPIYTEPNESLAAFNTKLIKLGCRKLKISTPLLHSSAMGVGGNRIEAIVEICKAVGASHYRSTPGAAMYLDDSAIQQFRDSGIDLSYHDYRHPVYKQCNYPDFISHLGFIDYLFNN